MHKSRIRLGDANQNQGSSEDYRAALNVITFEYFFRDYLDPAMSRWKNARVI